MTADCFVNPSICSGADKADDLVPVDDTDFALVANIGADPSISRVCSSGQQGLRSNKKSTHEMEVVVRETCCDVSLGEEVDGGQI
jgi:hypothetical protein